MDFNELISFLANLPGMIGCDEIVVSPEFYRKDEYAVIGKIFASDGHPYCQYVGSFSKNWECLDYTYTE